MKTVFVILFILFSLIAVTCEASSISYCKNKWKDNHTMFDRCLREHRYEPPIYTVEYDKIFSDLDTKYNPQRNIKKCVIKWMENEDGKIINPTVKMPNHRREEQL